MLLARIFPVLLVVGRRSRWRRGLLLAVLGFAAQHGWAQSPCPPVGFPTLDSASAVPVERYLARAVAMNGLADEIMPAPFGWNVTPDNTPCYRGGPPEDPNSYVDSLICQGRCTFQYCPANFEADVQLLVQLNASFVQFAAGIWDRPDQFVAGSYFLTAAGRTVARINAAYDCAGLQRPFIQASVLENIDESRTCAPPDTPCEPWMKPGPPGTNSGVNQVPIPAAVIEAYLDEMVSPEDRAYYLDATGRARQDLKFNFFRIAYQYWDAFYAPDITRLEGRLWMYYQARCYLDLGFTALHLGQPQIWARLAGRPAAERPAGLHQVAQLVAHIRAYARTLPGHPALLLTAEPINDPATNHRTLVKMADGRAATGQDQLIFDFNMASMHARETSPELDERVDGPQGTAVGTSYPCPVIDPHALATDACAGQPLATIDPCHGYNFIPDGGGKTSLGYVYSGQEPYVVYFDHDNTVNRLPNGDLRPTGVLQPGTDGTWGWDDSAWFSRGLSESCQVDWLAYEMDHVRSFSPSRGFLAAPGRLTNNVRVGLPTGPGKPAHPEASVPDYRLAAHPTVAAALSRLWQPTVPNPTVTVVLAAGVSGPRCASSGVLKRHRSVLPAWVLQVPNPDVTSIYTWHIRGPQGPELVMTGTTQLFLPTQAGSYTVALQQDNLGLPARTGGRREVVLPGPFRVEAQCVSRAAARTAARTLPVLP
jgi:hypothetical protein